ncbi:MAG: CDP-alcohol phosphatidyltransferase family protein [Bifidobacteriaceae bacterium]|jgi:CDP-diacylglycerol--serine O-phosphatidyltransferase|nr:CDP-alcohol phosphatidyltransferase family protein [Bifidobacteriaceae bacterium]
MLAGPHPANLVTYAGVAAGVAGLGWAGAGEVALALICLTAAGLADLFDGAFAGRFQRTALERRLGVALDSLADAVCFLALPAAVTLATGSQPWAWAAATVYVIAGLTRLAWFDADAHERAAGSEPAAGLADQSGGPSDPAAPSPAVNPEPERPAPRLTHYRGLPVTYAALVAPLAGLAGLAFAPAQLGWLMAGSLLVLAVLFVWDVPVAKPRGFWNAVLILVAVGLTAGLAAVR